MPGLVEKVIGGGPGEVATLMSAFGVGSMIGRLWVATLTSRGALIRVALGAMPTFALAMIALSWAPNLCLALPLAALVGFGIIVRAISTQSLMQLECGTAIAAASWRSTA